MFLESRSRPAPGSYGVVDQRLFTGCQEDGTNLITPYSLVLLSQETPSVSAAFVFRLPQVDSDSNYEHRVPLKWP